MSGLLDAVTGAVDEMAFWPFSLVSIAKFLLFTQYTLLAQAQKKQPLLLIR
jgi:hypothetical protein